MVIDTQNRTFKTLRISLTGLCNLGCVYCVSNNEKKPLYKKKVLSPLEIITIVKQLHQTLDLRVIRLTGGEPTLYPALLELIQGLSQMQVEIKMTTNAFNLEHLIEPMYTAGLQQLNISLDAISELTFRKISNRKNLQKILSNITQCISTGYDVKLNTVVVKGVNEHEIIDILEYGIANNVPVRFLELMKMGHLFSNGFEDHYFSEYEILEIIKTKYPFIKDLRQAHATAHYFRLSNGYKFGVIANESDPFCSDCDRLRLDISGNIYGCLSDNTPIDISEDYLQEKVLHEKLILALSQKQSDYFKGSDLSMLAIGG
ncbi:MAG TPA: GTP 3',8-cyclase MoaA [Cytophagales bacterium]|nr:GTP 3',8-cyclase MoaA [Cytophagales bacterium]